jgi:hypothetical protein
LDECWYGAYMQITKRDLLKQMEEIPMDSLLNISVNNEDIEPVVSVEVTNHPDSNINEFCIDFTV